MRRSSATIFGRRLVQEPARVPRVAAAPTAIQPGRSSAWPDKAEAESAGKGWPDQLWPGIRRGQVELPHL